MKYQRHMKILELVQTEAIETQEQLLDRLCANGFSVTQATVSRDIKELRLFKRLDKSGRSRYDVEAAASDSTAQSERYQGILRDGICNIDIAGHLVVIKCYAGMAQAVCAAIDTMSFDGVVGSLAGDDTIFLAIKTNDKAQELALELQDIFQ